jgi:hypothetical protein
MNLQMNLSTDKHDQSNIFTSTGIYINESMNAAGEMSGATLS